jgi:hypothetical protein
MAATLRCPDCGHRHELAAVAGRNTFPCASCGRPLKVPEQYRTASPPASAPTTSSPPPEPERVAGGRVEVQPMPREGAGSQLLPPLPDRSAADVAPLGRVWRVLIWVAAVPLGAMVGGFVGTRVGLVSTDEVEDAFLESGAARFVPLVILVLAWAVATALIVQGAIAGIDAWRRRRAARSASAHRTRDPDGSGGGGRPVPAAAPTSPAPSGDGEATTATPASPSDRPPARAS